jgi:hypothetical protein
MRGLSGDELSPSKNVEGEVEGVRDTSSTFRIAILIWKRIDRHHLEVEIRKGRRWRFKYGLWGMRCFYFPRSYPARLQSHVVQNMHDMLDCILTKASTPTGRIPLTGGQ